MLHKILGIISLGLFGVAMLCGVCSVLFNLLGGDLYAIAGLMLLSVVLSMVLGAFFFVAWLLTGVGKMEKVSGQPYSVTEKIIVFLLVCGISWIVFNLYSSR